MPARAMHVAMHIYMALVDVQVADGSQLSVQAFHVSEVETLQEKLDIGLSTTLCHPKLLQMESLQVKHATSVSKD